MTSRECLAAAGVAVLLVAAGCGLPERVRGLLGPPERPNVVLVLVDQLRKDSFDAWAVRTRELASWGGVTFEQMRSVAPWTYPSVVSLMSGLYPQQHGADGEESANRLRRFSPDVPLVQRILRDAGYRTAAFVTNPFLREWNPFHTGFDAFHAGFVKNIGNRRGTYPEFADPERMFASNVNREIRRHFDAAPPEAPEFTYIHYIDVHGPWRGAPFAPAYKAAVQYVDERIVELYEYFMERYDGDLLFFVTSDHGRALGDDVSLGYGPTFRLHKHSVHDFNLRIPFLVLPSPAVRGRGTTDVSCSNVDFVPTLLDLLGLESEVALPGRSLAPWIRGEPAPDAPDRPVYAQMRAFGHANDAVVIGRRKYVRFLDPATGEPRLRRIFDLERDPDETRSLGSDFGAAEPAVSEAAGTRGLAFEPRITVADEDLADQLRGLGYLDDAPGGEEAASP